MLFQKRTSANVPAVRGRNLATVCPNDANDVLPHSAENGASADTNNSISVKSAKWTVFPDRVTYIYILVNATALGLAYPAARQMACTSCSVGISDLKPLTGTSADQLPHTKSRSLATA